MSILTIHGNEWKYATAAYETNWIFTVERNINEVEQQITERVGVEYVVTLSVGTALFHLAMKRVGDVMYGHTEIGKGVLFNQKIVQM